MNSEAIARMIYGAAIKLDAEDFKGFMRQCGDDFRYSIRSYSPELGQEMVWLEHDRKGMQDLFAMLPKHVRMTGRFKRHVSVYSVDRDDDRHARAHSSVLLVHTDMEGNSKLFAAGQYEDLIDTAGDTPRILERVVRLETRNLGPGVHVPV
ncbi:MAG: hydroxylase [Hydrogenophaga sp.]|jgi:methanesulfonate monooxygenase subunit beta|uniref:Hydroxylase n=1 Tax=Hydrogenophaga borbori TaxID=2294117 RepID=A0A372EE70_9BURK|nr:MULTISPECIES: aromatic-ring-hydroxylating dioxygenase subunit beta [Hydrogenophaga]MBX3608617.1 hydroxylase [Hydrogenophaga sp.]RFP76170.1 hydroxylase [Hydrogenophaga borbori]